MRCPTCGENLDGSEAQCPTCGAVVPRGVVRQEGVERCPRCGYRGMGVGHFKRPGAMAILCGLSLMYAVPGVVYWLVKRNNVVCPNCGLGWEHSRSDGRITRAVEQGLVTRSRVRATPDLPLPRSGMGRRVVGTGIILLGMVMVAAGIADGELVLAAVGSVMAGGGSLTAWWGFSALGERRRALMARLQKQVILLAQERDGTLTVTDVAADLNLSLQAAEKVLNGMDDGFRVRSDVSDAGVIYYEFPEVLHRKLLDTGEVKG